MDALGLPVLAWCALSLALAGVVKGIMGIGIPLVSISLLTIVISVPEAVLLLPVPIMAANVWQSMTGGYFIATCRRFWAVLAGVAVGTVAGAGLLTSLSDRLLMGIVGGVLIAFAASALLDVRISIRTRYESAAGALAGTVGGVLSGVSSVVGPPIIMLMVSLGLSKEEFVGTIATIYLMAGIFLSVAFAGYGVLDAAQFLWSALAALPLFLGLAAGTWVRRRVSERTFRKALLAMLLLIGLNLLRRAL